MTDEQLVEHVRSIIREEIEAEGKRTHADISTLRVAVEAAESRLANRIKDLEVSNGRLEKGQQELKESQQRIEKKLEKEITGNAEALQEIVAELSRLDDHEARIMRLEEDAKFLPH